jgi:hypothetical protein
MTGVAKKTVMRLLVEVGEVCVEYQERAFRNLNSKRLQLDDVGLDILQGQKPHSRNSA